MSIICAIFDRKIYFFNNLDFEVAFRRRRECNKGAADRFINTPDIRKKERAKQRQRKRERGTLSRSLLSLFIHLSIHLFAPLFAVTTL